MESRRRKGWKMMKNDENNEWMNLSNLHYSINAATVTFPHRSESGLTTNIPYCEWRRKEKNQIIKNDIVRNLVHQNDWIILTFLPFSEHFRMEINHFINDWLSIFTKNCRKMSWMVGHLVIYGLKKPNWVFEIHKITNIRQIVVIMQK